MGNQGDGQIRDLDHSSRPKKGRFTQGTDKGLMNGADRYGTTERGGRVMRLLPAVFILALATAGCASVAPVEEVHQFGQAFANVRAASQPLFDDLAAAERGLGRGKAERTARTQGDGGEDGSQAEKTVLAPAASGIPEIAVDSCRSGTPGWQSTNAKDAAGREIGFIDGFCLDDAVYFGTIGDPPATHRLRVALQVLDDYSQVLLILAEGRNIAEAQAQLQHLGSGIAGVLSLIPPAAPGAAAIGPLLTSLAPLVEEAARAQNIQEMRDLTVKAAPAFGRLLAALEAAAPEMFEVLTRSAQRRVPKETRNNPQLAADVVHQIDGYRSAVSNFVLLLEELKGAHGEIIAALAQAENAPPSLSMLADRAARLNAQATALRQAFVILRRGPQ